MKKPTIARTSKTAYELGGIVFDVLYFISSDNNISLLHITPQDNPFAGDYLLFLNDDVLYNIRLHIEGEL